MTTDSAKTMTLEQVRDELYSMNELSYLPSPDKINAMASSIDAHLATREVSDEDVERACERFMQVRGIGMLDAWKTLTEDTRKGYRSAMRAALQAIQADRRRGGVVVPVVRPETYTEQVYALARRCLWIAFNWNDHNFDAAHTYARKESELCGLHDFDAANDWLEREALLPHRCQVRKGWKLVPVEPTDKMIDAAEKHWTAETIYKVMLAAAPDADAEGNGNG